jgi:hypothetical protein
MKNHPAAAIRITINTTPIAIPATAPFDNELELLVLLGRANEVVWLAGRVVGDGVVTPEGTEAVIAAVRTLNPFTCIPYTIVGPVEMAVVGGTVEVTTPQGPFGVVDS